MFGQWERVWVFCAFNHMSIYTTKAARSNAFFYYPEIIVEIVESGQAQKVLDCIYTSIYQKHISILGVNGAFNFVLLHVPVKRF